MSSNTTLWTSISGWLLATILLTLVGLLIIKAYMTWIPQEEEAFTFSKQKLYQQDHKDPMSRWSHP